MLQSTYAHHQTYAQFRRHQAFETGVRHQKGLYKLVTKDRFGRSVSQIIHYIDRKTANLATLDQVKHLPTKAEHYTQTEKIIKEIQDLRRENAVLAYQVVDVRDRIETIETKLGIIPD